MIVRVVLGWFAIGALAAAEASDGAAAPSLVEPLAAPAGAVLVAALLRGWTPTIRVIHVRDNTHPPA